MNDSALARWENDLSSQGKSPETVAAYLGDVRRYGGLPQDWAERAEAIRSSGLAPRTIARHLASHAALARYWPGVKPELFAARPRMGVVLPGVVPLPDEMKRFIAAEPDPMWKALWAVMCGAGLRVSEAAGVTWNDLRVTGTGKVLRVMGKGMKVRDIPVSREVDSILGAWFLGLPCPAERTDRIFPVTVRTVQRRVKTNARRAGLPESWHPHALRHGFATAAWENTGNLRVVGDLLGHSGINTTMIYTHVRSEHRELAVAGII